MIFVLSGISFSGTRNVTSTTEILCLMLYLSIRHWHISELRKRRHWERGILSKSPDCRQPPLSVRVPCNRLMGCWKLLSIAIAVRLWDVPCSVPMLRNWSIWLQWLWRRDRLLRSCVTSSSHIRVWARGWINYSTYNVKGRTKTCRNTLITLLCLFTNLSLFLWQ